MALNKAVYVPKELHTTVNWVQQALKNYFSNSNTDGDPPQTSGSSGPLVVRSLSRGRRNVLLTTPGGVNQC